MPFKEARIGTSLLNFEDIYDETSWLGPYGQNQVMGIVGDVTPSLTNAPSILFNVGYAQT